MRTKRQHIKLMKESMVILICLILFNGIVSCDSDENSFTADENPLDTITNPISNFYVLPNLETPEHYPGIPIYTANMAKNRSTEVNSEWVIRKSSNVSVNSEIIRNGFNAMHKISFDRIQNTNDYMELVMAIHGKLVNRVPVPEVFLENLNGISFRAVSYETPINLTLEAYNIDGTILKTENFEISKEDMQTFKMDLNSQELHHISFRINNENQEASNFSDGAIGIDDVYLTTAQNTIFEPPSDDTQFLNWLKTASINFFLWNYRDIGGGQGVVLEASDETQVVSLSGIGYAYGVYIIAEQENLISPDVARQRILSMLRWQEAQNWYNGLEGVFGMPYHYFDINGNGLYNQSAEAVSTIDWAMCAAGIRTVRQKYASDIEIVTICNTLLNRPQWPETVHDNPNDTYRFGRITKGFSSSGTKNGQVWADAFSEETEIVYLEALASGQVNDLDLSRIYRELKNGYYVSWFGCGFTYNWLQLWTGSIEPYQSNSIAAFQSDASTSTSSFGQTYLGLTACATIGNVESNGLINWNNYIGNQGSSVSGANANEVIQISPAPYGAALAVPFIPSEAIQSLRNYADLGYYHPLLGLPDNIRMKDLPGSINVPVPNWNPYDLNVGAFVLAIEQHQQNTVAQYYMNDDAVEAALQQLIQSF